MTRTVYSLLVGIDAYQSPVSALSGCVNDIREIETYLQERVAGDDTTVDVVTLTDQQATRQAIKTNFADHLGKAGPNDVALFYYSGHGSQQPTAAELRHLEPDGLDETLVCYDSRSAGGWDLSDKELAQLIRNVEKSGAHLVLVLDCCHSGTATRAMIDGVGVRRVPTDERIRPLESYELEDGIAAGQLTRSASRDATGWALPGGSKHLLMSACRADQLSKELSIDGRTRGIFSYSLLTTLASASGTMSYRDLHKRVESLVRSKVGEQTPQIETANPDVLHQAFLGGDVVTSTGYFTMRHDRDKGWVIDGGAIHGIPRPEGTETTILALFRSDEADPRLDDLSSSVGQASVKSVDAHASQVEPAAKDGSELDKGMTYRAVVASTPLAPIGVLLEGEEAGVATAKAKLPTLIVAESEAGSAALRVTARDGGYRISRMGDERALVVDISGGYTADNATKMLSRLEHIARWIRAEELTNPTTRLPADAVTISIFRKDPATGDEVPDIAAGGEEIVLNYERKDGNWQEPTFWIRLTNSSQRRLYCALFDLTARYGINAGLLRGEWLDPGQEVWGLAREPIAARIPDDLWRNDKVIDYRDTLKLVASTEEFDSSLLEQGNLDEATRRSAPTAKVGSTLSRLMARVQNRDFGAASQAGESLADWVTSELTITTVRPLEAKAISSTDAVDVDGVTVLEHPSLVAKARLTSVPVASRSLDALVLPRLLRDDPGLVQPLEFTASRGGEPGLSVLELLDVENPGAVTPENPLRIRTGVRLSEDEHVLPVGFDGEFFLPLGVGRRTADGTEILIERLPPNQASEDLERPDTRSIGGSLKIFFHKVVGKVLGADYPYPILAATDLTDDGEVRYTQDPDDVRRRVEQASRILLVVHGIIGDTRGMAEQAHAINDASGVDLAPPLARHYDLILAFDYENLHTPIAETARGMLNRLREVGLGEGHGKELDILAHSLGGLVSRWMIEREGGAPMVQQLVLLGTPNGGSPWATVQKWATMAIGLGLNAMTTVVWPVKVLGWLAQSLERIDETLDQMEPGSAVLKALSESSDPGVPYTVIAGNTSVIAQAATGGKLERLLDRLDPVGKAANLAFFGQPNDIAVSVSSIHNIPKGRQPEVVALEVGCDHSTYLVTEAGKRAVIEALP